MTPHLISGSSAVSAAEKKNHLMDQTIDRGKELVGTSVLLLRPKPKRLNGKQNVSFNVVMWLRRIIWLGVFDE